MSEKWCSRICDIKVPNLAYKMVILIYNILASSRTILDYLICQVPIRTLLKALSFGLHMLKPKIVDLTADVTSMTSRERFPQLIGNQDFFSWFQS